VLISHVSRGIAYGSFYQGTDLPFSQAHLKLL